MCRKLFGASLQENIRRNEFVAEYTGELINHKEADRRGKAYDRDSNTYLFDLNDDWVIDAKHRGNKMRFANHRCSPAPCKASCGCLCTCVSYCKHSGCVGCISIAHIAVSAHVDGPAATSCHLAELLPPYSQNVYLAACVLAMLSISNTVLRRTCICFRCHSEFCSLSMSSCK